MIFIIIGIVVLFILGLLSYFQKTDNRNKWVDTEDFQKWKKSLTLRSDWEEFEEFMSFLEGYGGGYVKRKSGRIVK